MTRTIFIITLLIFCQACSKQWLDAKSDKKKIIPSSLQDFQALLSHEAFLNTSSAGFMAEAGTDDSYIDNDLWMTLPSFQQNSYIWNSDLFQGITCPEWKLSYQRIFIANSVLEGLQNVKITPDNSNTWNTLNATALFFRAYAFYQLAQVFGQPYDSSSADIDMGIPLRKSTDLDVPSTRNTVKETYDLLIADLTTSMNFLPEHSSKSVIPVRAAAAAMLARVFLTTGNYNKALEFSNLSLSENDQLIDFNELNAELPNPLSQFNSETIYYDQGVYYKWFSASSSNTDTSLYNQYIDEDLRKTIYFKNNGPNMIMFRGSYTGSSFYPFTGLATDEQYLIRAECNARKGLTGPALADLNKLMKHRYKTGLYIPYVMEDPEAILRIILAERRKELVFRGLRWTDLRRLNKEGRFKKEVVRSLNGNEHKLLPGSNKYTFPIPDEVILLTGMPQNNRL